MQAMDNPIEQSNPQKYILSSGKKYSFPLEVVCLVSLVVLDKKEHDFPLWSLFYGLHRDKSFH